MRIISWNIHNRASLWEEVASLDADIALLQEAPKPPKSLSSKLNIVSNNDWYTAKGRKGSFRPWRTTIVALSDNIDINCGCFKVSAENPGSQVGFRRIIEDIIYLGLSLLILNRGERKWELYPKS